MKTLLSITVSVLQAQKNYIVISGEFLELYKAIYVVSEHIFCYKEHVIGNLIEI